MPHVPTGGKPGRPRKYPEGMSQTEIRKLQREAKVAAAVTAPPVVTPAPVAAPSPAPKAPTPQSVPAASSPGQAPRDPAKAAKDAAGILGLPTVPPPPPPGAPPPLALKEKEQYCVDRIQMVKAMSAWALAKRLGIDTDAQPIPRKVVEVSQGFETEIRLNAEFLYPYLAVVSGPWALLGAAFFEVMGMMSALREIAPKRPQRPAAAQPPPPKKTEVEKASAEHTGGFPPAGSPPPEVEMK